MAIQTIQYFRDKFITGYVITEQDYQDWLDTIEDLNNIFKAGSGNFSIEAVNDSSPTSTGSYSMSIGSSYNEGDFSFTAGDFCDNLSNYSAVLGNSNSNSGENSFVAGNSNINEGENGATLNSNNKSEGDNSISVGKSNDSKSYCELNAGMYSEDYTANSKTDYDVNDKVFVVGNGVDASNRNDAFTVWKGGAIQIKGTDINSFTPVEGMIAIDSFTSTLNVFYNGLWHTIINMAGFQQ